jgi:hypothetical protein
MATAIRSTATTINQNLADYRAAARASWHLINALQCCAEDKPTLKFGLFVGVRQRVLHFPTTPDPSLIPGMRDDNDSAGRWERSHSAFRPSLHGRPKRVAMSAIKAGPCQLSACKPDVHRAKTQNPPRQSFLTPF